MQAIQTKYINPTNFRGARIKASCSAKTKIFDWDYALDVDENHARAALNLFFILKWDEYNAIVGQGSLKDGSQVFVLGPKPKVYTQPQNEALEL